MSFNDEQRHLKKALGLAAVGIIGLGITAKYIDNADRGIVADSIGTRETDIPQGIEQIIESIPEEERIMDPLNKESREVSNNLVYESEHEDLDYERLYQDLKRHEGVRKTAYDDTDGKSIGVGFNLEGSRAIEEIESLGLNYNSVYNGNIELNEKQIDKLLENSVNVAVSDAKTYIGRDCWDDVDEEAKEVIVSMAYNLGINRLSGFVKLREVLRAEDYVKAADEMENSKWYSQVGDRSEELVDRMRSIR